MRKLRRAAIEAEGGVGLRRRCGALPQIGEREPQFDPEPRLVGRERRRLAVACDRRLERTLHLQRFGEAGMGGARGGPERQGAAIMRRGGLEAAKLGQSMSEIDVDLGDAGPRGEHPLERCDRLREPPQLRERGAEIDARIDVVRPERERALVVRDRRGELVALPQEVGEIELRFGGSGIELCRAPVMPQRFRGAADAEERVPHAVMQFGRVFAAGERPGDQLDRERAATALGGERAAPVERRHVVRIERERARIEPLGVREAAGAVMLQSLRNKPLDRAGALAEPARAARNG